MSVSTESPIALNTVRRSVPDASPEPESRPSHSLYRVIWRWHFYAGLFVAPVLIVMAATGALYIFKDELEGLIHARVLYVEPGASRVSYDEQIAAAIVELPKSFHVDQVSVWPDPARSTEIYAHDEVAYARVMIDPYRGNVLGKLGDDDIFPIILKIHRTLFVGTLGRIVTELVTCWTIVLLITGVYLWWPRKGNKTWGTWLPRLRRHPYVALRDLHAVSGVYVAAIVLVIASTGLLYTYVWGTGYNLAALQTGAYEIFLNPPKSESPADAPRLPIEKIVAAAAQALPNSTLTVGMPHKPDEAFVVFASGSMGPSTTDVAILDHATGRVLGQRTNSEFPALSWWATWNYPLHVGSILGLWTKVPWLIASGTLMLLPVTGVWMWWQRRPRGRTGFPRKPDVRVPRALVVGILILAAVLPVLGLSIAAILLGEKSVSMLRGKPSPASS